MRRQAPRSSRGALLCSARLPTFRAAGSSPRAGTIGKSPARVAGPQTKEQTLDEVQFGEGAVAVFTDHDMIEHANADELARLFQPLRDRPILR